MSLIAEEGRGNIAVRTGERRDHRRQVCPAGPPVEILAAEPNPARGPDEVDRCPQATPAAHEGERRCGTLPVRPGRPFDRALPAWHDSSLNGLAVGRAGGRRRRAVGKCGKAQRVDVCGETSPSARRCQAQQQQADSFHAGPGNLHVFPPWTDGEWYSRPTGCTGSEDYSFCNESDSCSDLH